MLSRLGFGPLKRSFPRKNSVVNTKPLARPEADLGNPESRRSSLGPAIWVGVRLDRVFRGPIPGKCSGLYSLPVGYPPQYEGVRGKCRLKGEPLETLAKDPIPVVAAPSAAH